MDRRSHPSRFTGAQITGIQWRHLANLSYAVYWVYRCTYQLQQWLFQQLTPLGVGVLGMLILTGLLGFWSLQSLCHQLFFLCLSLLTLALISRQFIKLSFQVERVVPTFGRVSEPFHYSIHIKNLTLQGQTGLKFLEVIDISYLTFHEFLKVYSPRITQSELNRRLKRALAKRQWAIAPLIDLPPLKIRGQAEITGHLIPLRRGRLTLDHLTLKAVDPLGLSYQGVCYEQPQSVCILPQRYKLPVLFAVNHQALPVGDTVLTSAVGESLEFRSLRDYRPGDPTNKIHWKSWAKVGHPVVREQQAESMVHHGLLLDTMCPDKQSDVFEEMLAIATSIILQTQNDTALLDVMFASHGVRCITTGSSRQHQAPLLEMIATMTPSQTHTFQDLIPLAQSRLTRLSSYVCLLIQWDSIRQTFLENVARHDIPTKAIVICDGAQKHEGLRYLSLSQSCTVSFISLDQIQQDLLQL